ncbi:iron-sulfur cluster biosynthesis family protein [Lentilactobacillus parafarraginis]|jgi:uncharacterized protein YqkB|uniref:Iron-sulfur cluster biosynthesis family protein n=1 Tax=Lentilactobacillus parafarraginis TaxID=390842 RepID=A0A5R9CNS0_9LACO|nr:iron-sulfur cluster biosynthesis family protein [Lentilactobacillus parafarraginis]TLQ16634.1 iron-sulfur cluster biosynthesis family protein [Lentilactobacillus parafarraginis]
MKLTITDQAFAKLREAVPADSRLLLSFDDGVGPFSKVGVCSLDTSYDIIAVAKDARTPDYEQTLATNHGDWQLKGYSAVYLDNNMKLDFKNHQLVLSGESGILDSSVDIKDLAKQEA